MPQIYYCDMEKFEHLYEECIALLPMKRREKAERKINKNAALLSAVSGLMMKKVLGITDDEMLCYNEHGKPFLKNGPFFSISHSRRYAVLSVSNEQIGIDIEMNRDIDEGIINRCFTEDEGIFARMSTENYLRIWTAKEAVLKLLGTGFSFSPKNFSVLPFDEEHEINGINMRFFVSTLGDAPLTAAYCGNNNEFEITELLPEDLIY